MKRTMRLLASALVFCLMISGAAHAAKPSTHTLQEEARTIGPRCIGGSAQVIHSGNLRTAASEHSGKLGTVTAGETYRITGYYSTAEGRSWLEIDHPDGRAWVSASLVRIHVSSGLEVLEYDKDQLIGCRVTITGGREPIRAGAGAEYDALGYVRRGERYIICDVEASSTGQLWYQVYSTYGCGWIFSGTAEVAHMPAGVRIAAGPVSSIAASTAAPATEEAPVRYPVGCSCRIVAASVHVRAGAGTGYDVVADVYGGQTFAILDVQTADNGMDWYRIQVNGVDGYVFSGMVEIN